ncbi:UDP-N-acetylmuramate dehydrogenase [Simiduia aestuariiviva]|uniref:UDP-N-acetylenolpyruvoylglucosamine reductase n=1 Tax=Simiduia aestuariiviva TaxID=1510459 RepID=A0A839UKU5_9GAMM|nr:UDP-N-acetylmuramate dehydrogenase [Simiduia aestuariiviva]MBB3168462.1 UDP-N-acetylmuramate dehydrogenase [Simiduia aestuariiviva]
MATPALAEHFVCVSDLASLLAALTVAEKRNWPVTVLGGGSNVIFRNDVPGLVIQMAIKGIASKIDVDGVLVTAGAGERWQALVDFCIQRSLWGVENLTLIPGTVGAAPIQNIGAYGVELESVFHELTALRLADRQVVKMTRADCQFSYRQSRFKRDLERYIILDVTLRVSRTGEPVLHYPGLQGACADIEQALTPAAVAKAVAALRRAKLPDPQVIPNSGSFFHNPVVDLAQAAALKQRWPELVSYALPDSKVKLAAGWLIEQAGFKGVLRDGVGMHAAQALVMTNPGRRAGEQVLAHAQEVAAKVQAMFGVRLDIEPQILP